MTQQNSDNALYIPLSDVGDRQALRLGDDSLNREIQSGEYIVYRPVDRSECAELREGHFCVLERHQGGLSEITVQRLADVDGNKLRFAAYSTDQKYKLITTIDLNKAKADVLIIGVMVGRYHSYT